LAQVLKVNFLWIEAENLHWPDCAPELEKYDGILVPGGFGKRGIQGMLHAIRFARERRVPYFGICLGMQTMVIEFARNVCGIAAADSTEFEPATPARVIYKLRELLGVDELGGTMRLGAYPCHLAPGSLAEKAYESSLVSERHRHRFEFNREFEKVLTEHGLRITGQTPDAVYVEICELPDHPWMLGCQFHPEFKSKPLEPHPLFRAFLGAAYEHRQQRIAEIEQPLFTQQHA
jgi:CTP synthase